MEKMIEIRNLSLSFDKKKNVLNDINLDIYKNEIVGIVGPSGTGKSTLLRCLNFLNYPDTGTITIDGVTVNAEKISKKNVSEIRKKTSMVFQNYNLFKNMTALQNVMEALITVYHMNKDEAKELALTHLTKVGMEDHIDQYPSELSGGQQQRVGIARATALQPKVILLDEPTSALDPQLVGEVKKVIESLIEETAHLTIVIVTHDISFASRLTDRIVFMDEGTIKFVGSPDEFVNNREDERIVQFLDMMADD